MNPDETWLDFDTAPPPPEATPDDTSASAAAVYLLGGQLLDTLTQAHQADPTIPVLMLAPEIPSEVLKSVILAALTRLETGETR